MKKTTTSAAPEEGERVSEPEPRKKLIEVGLPLVAINAESAREKSIRHGHPSTLHLWWARRPLAACRAVLFASLVDDPDSDPQYRKGDGSVDEDRAGLKRADLFNLIEELVMWENSNNTEVIRTARAEIARCVASRMIEKGVLRPDATVGPKTTANDLAKHGHCHPVAMGLDTKVGRVRFSFDVSRLPPAEIVNAFLAGHAPPVLDPFAGGGSIPLEAQRLGLRVYASDLNPVPVLINKALIEIPPKFAGRPPVNPEAQGKKQGAKAKREKQKTLIEKEWHRATGLAEDVRYYGQWIRDEAEQRIGHLYPKIQVTATMAQDRPDLLPYVGQTLTVIAWLWARTVVSPNPACSGAHVPLVSTFWLSTKKGRKAWIEPIVDKQHNAYRFEVRTGFPDSPEIKQYISEGTKLGRGCRFRCILSDEPIDDSHVKTEGMADRMGVRLMAIVAEGSRERVYLTPSAEHERIALEAEPTGIDAIRTAIAEDKRAIWCLLYGLNRFDKLFTPRQLLALATFSDLVREARERIIHDSSDGRNREDYADAVTTYLAFSISKLSDRSSNLCSWFTERDSTRSTFSRQGLPMVWDFAELNTLNKGTGTFEGANAWTAEVIESLPTDQSGTVAQLDATRATATTPTAPIVSTDPPYYDNIGYADLSDFFYVWLRRSLGAIYPALFSTLLTPKSQELIASPYRHGGSKAKAQDFFESGLGMAFSRVKERHDLDVPMTIFYAFKQTENIDSEDGKEATASTASTGWETMLTGLISAGFTVRGTWPMRTELGNRMVGMGTNALASSIVLACRPRPANASLATRKEFLTAMRRELPEALRNLQRGNIAPVDLAQAAIGPGMAVFTRYAKVMESDGTPMSVRTALGLINQTLDEVLAEQEGEFDGDTRWALAWFEQFGITEGPFGDAETLSKAKNTAVNGLVEAGVVKARAGKVQLLSRNELPNDWDPATDKRLTVWETTQHLIRILERDGELVCAALLNKLGGIAETARDLAYRLYAICERKKWAEEALAYNGLVIVWPELTKLAMTERSRPPTTQQAELF